MYEQEEKTFCVDSASFKAIREDNCYFVDKTDLLYKMLRHYRAVLFTRPRRFGKSLLVNILEHLFLGHQTLFKGTAIEPLWDWSQTRGVIRLDFTRGSSTNAKNLKILITEQIELLLDYNNFPAVEGSLAKKFSTLVYKLSDKMEGRSPVLLIDEYDAPLTKYITNPTIAKENREELKRFYELVKSLQSKIKFVFLTGVMKFDHIGIASGANHITDLSLHPDFNALCGFTEKEILTTFSDHLTDKISFEKLRVWYNGYAWGGGEWVYNPISVMYALQYQKVNDYWARKGTTETLSNVLEANTITNRTLLEVIDKTYDRDLLNAPVALNYSEQDLVKILFRTGYATIDYNHTETTEGLCKLKIPNHEITINVTT